MTSYTRVPIQDSSSNSSIEKDATPSSSSNNNVEEKPASKLMVVFSVAFYLVAATTSKLNHSPRWGIELVFTIRRKRVFFINIVPLFFLILPLAYEEV